MMLLTIVAALIVISALAIAYRATRARDAARHETDLLRKKAEWAASTAQTARLLAEAQQAVRDRADAMNELDEVWKNTRKLVDDARSNFQRVATAATARSDHYRKMVEELRGAETPEPLQALHGWSRVTGLGDERMLPNEATGKPSHFVTRAGVRYRRTGTIKTGGYEYKRV